MPVPETMDRFSHAVIAIYLVSGLVAFAAYVYPPSAPNLDHPVDWRRWFNRILGYAYCNFLSCMFSPVIIGALVKPYRWLGGPTLSIRDTPWSSALLVVGPIPLALVFFHFLLRFQRSRRRRTIKALRRSGLLPPIVPLPGTPSPVPYRAHDFGALDLHDDDIVRELARTHWQAINHAAASSGDVDAALQAQHRFLDTHVPCLDPALAAHVREVYADASVAPARELARIASLKKEQAVDMLHRRKRFLQNSLILSIVSILLAILGLIMRFTH